MSGRCRRSPAGRQEISIHCSRSWGRYLTNGPTLTNRGPRCNSRHRRSEARLTLICLATSFSVKKLCMCTSLTSGGVRTKRWYWPMHLTRGPTYKGSEMDFWTAKRRRLWTEQIPLRQYATDCDGLRYRSRLTCDSLRRIHDVLRQPTDPSGTRKRQKTPGKEHKGLFYIEALFPGYAARFHRVGGVYQDRSRV